MDESEPDNDPAQVMVPELTQPWAEATRIVGNGEDFYSDFCLIQDKVGRWHAIGIHFPIDTFFHAVSEDLTKPFALQAPITSGDPETDHMWAPYAVWESPERALLYYCHSNTGMRLAHFQMRMLTADAPRLDTWAPYDGPQLEGNVVFQEPGDRDACIFWDDSIDKYLMYYSANEPQNVPEEELPTTPGSYVRVRTSTDLFNWSDPKTVMTIPPGYQAAESPFVLKRDGLYYLWVSGYDYGKMSLYISEDPMDFGDPVENRITEQSGHAPEIVSVDGVDYMACCAIASKFGNEPGAHDLKGVFIQPMQWTQADAATLARIHRAGKD